MEGAIDERGVLRRQDARLIPKVPDEPRTAPERNRDYWNYIMNRLLPDHIEFVIRAIVAVPGRARRHGVAVLKPHLQLTRPGGTRSSPAIRGLGVSAVSGVIGARASVWRSGVGWKMTVRRIHQNRTPVCQ